MFSQGPETCFAIFLPALVMGNFMVLNLFLALLLNSFNSEELKSKKEVRQLSCGDDVRAVHSPSTGVHATASKYFTLIHF
jgi:hypothetical protein